MMTWEEISKRIAEMTPEQRARPAGIGMRQTGEIAHVWQISSAEDFNGTLPEYLIFLYDARADYP